MTRIASLDIFRAVTMLLMIWVNDYAGVPGVAKWMLHAGATEDYLGFSDIIFPLFLFIVGLSIPLAIHSRFRRRDTQWNITKHILIRGFSLLLIGVYMVNYESAPQDLYLLGEQGWCFVMAFGVTLIWMDWRRSPLPKKFHQPLEILGSLILVVLAIIYAQSGSWMATHWWGILGLIGWAYLANALIFVMSNGNIWWVIVSVFGFFALSVFGALEVLPPLPVHLDFISTLYGGTTPAFTAVGVLAMLIFQNAKYRLTLLVGIGIGLLTLGILTRPFWGISKIQATPSWLWICLGIGFQAFVLFHYIVDIKNMHKWANIIKPAGTATLTCYLLPYFIYPFKSITNFYPLSDLSNGIVGLAISMLFAIGVVIFTGWLERKGFKLKL